MSSKSSRVAGAISIAAGLAALCVIDLPAQVASRPDPATERFRGRDAAAREVLVALRPSADLTRLGVDLDADDTAPIGAGRLHRIRSRSRSVASLMAALAGRSDVAYVEPNYLLYALREPNDPRFPELWGLRNVGQVINGTAGVPDADINAAAAWDKALGSRNVVVGVVDTGVDYSHPDVGGNVWSAPASFTVTVGGRTITCAAGTHGFNAITKACDPFDDHFHGTHVSGTIGALGNNGAGVAGVNWFASIMGLKFLSANGSGTTGDAINAIEFAIQAKARFTQAANVRVLSNSWGGGPFSQALLDEIIRAGQNDMLFVAAAGNSASDNDALPSYPASYAAPNVVAVAATDNQDALASFSNFGATSVHLGAPGVQVLSSVPGAAYAYFSGTSMATPHVSGAAALLLSRCPADTATVKALILNNVDPVPSLNGITATGGRLDVGRAVAACGRPSNAMPTVTLTAPAAGTIASTPGSVFIAATAGDGDGSIAQVAFYAGTSLLGIDTTAPYDVTWTDPLVGTHLITAVATDNEGATATSAAALVRVLPPAAPFGGTAAQIPGLIEAENFNDGGEGLGYHDLTVGNTGGLYRQTDVDIQTTSDVGGGYALGYVDGGEWLAYTISAFGTSNYTIEARVASQGAGGSFHVELDGLDVTGRMAVPDTGGWQVWQSINSPPVPIAAGSHLVRVVMDTRGASGFVGNLNYFRFSAPGVNRPPIVQLTSPAAGSYLAPATIPLAAAASDPDGTVAQVAFYAGSLLIGADSVAPFAFSWNNVPAGAYSLTAVATDNAGATTTSAPVSVQVVNPPDSTPFGGQPAAIPGTIEAENFDDGGEGVAYHDLVAGNAGGKYRQSDVDIESTTDAGGGYSLGWVSAGEWLKYSVSVVSTAAYTLEVRAASPTPGGTLHVEVDGIDATGPLVIPNTGGWQTWRSIPVGGIQLAAGRHTLRLVADSNGPSGYLGNLNFLRWSVTAPGNAPPAVQITSPADGSTVPPGTVTVNATASDADGTIAQVAFYAGSTLLGVDTAAPYSLPWTGAAIGDYTLTARALDSAGGVTTSAPILVHVAGTPASTPFGGTRAAIPGTIEAENFDEGGEGLAYHDSTPGNAGGKYRQTDVDIETTTDVGGGFSLGYVAAGEWIAYSVAVNAAGSYTLQARVASTTGNATFHVEIDGVNVTGPMTMPNTGGWQTWTTISRAGIALAAGPHLMKVVFDTAAANGFVGNFNYIAFTAQ